MLRNLTKLADGATSLSAAIGALGLIAEVVIILIDVIGRALGKPLYGSQDLVTMTMILLVFGAMALCDKRGGNIAVDLFERHYPPALNHAIDILSALIGAAIFTALAWAVLASAKLSVMLNLSTNLLNLPKAWFQWALCAFALIAALSMILRAVDLLLRGRQPVQKDGQV